MNWPQSFLLLIVLVFVWHLSHQAGRLDRLHHRIDVSRAALDGHLIRRTATVTELAVMLDPASAVILSDAAYEARAVDEHDDEARIQVENQLTNALRETLGEMADVAELKTNPLIAKQLEQLIADSDRIELSRRFHADAVRDCLHLRNQWLVRFFRLAGHAPMPRSMDFDDQLPASLR